MNKNMAVTVALEGIDKLNPKLKQAIGQIKEIEGKTLSARDKLRTLVVLDNQFKGLDTAKAKLGEVSAALEKAKQRAQETSMFHKLGQATEGEMRAAAIAVEKLENKFSDLSDAVGRAQSKIAGRGFANIDQVRAGMPAQIAAAQKAADAQARVDAARNRAGAMQSQAGGFAIAGATMMGSGYAILAPLQAATQAASAYNAELRQIAITADMTDAQMIQIRNRLAEVSAQTNQSVDVLKLGFGSLIAAGQSADVADRSILTIGKVATAYKAEVASIAAASFVLNDALGIAPEKLQGSLGMLAKAGKEGNVELRDMAASLPQLGAGLAALQMKGPEAVATMAASLQIARKGAKTADEAANNMQNFLVKVLSPDTLKKAQKNFGLDLYGVVTRAQRSGKNPIEAAMASINRVTRGGDPKLLGELFQDSQVQSFLRPMLQNLDEYQRIKTEVLAAGGGQIIDEDFAKSAKDMEQTTGRMGNAWEVLKIKIGTALEPALQPVIDKLASATTKIIEFTSKYPKLTQWMAVAAGVLGVLLVAFGLMALGIAAVMIPLATFGVAAAMLGVGMLPLALIILGIGAAIALVVAGLYYFSDGISAVFSSISEFFGEAFDLISDGKWGELGALLISGLIDGILITLGALFTLVGEIVSGFWNIILETNWTELGAAILNGIVDGLKAGVSFVAGIVSGIAESLKGAFKSALGINSPSRVFMEMGGYTTAGLAMGLTRGTPDVISTVNRLASGVTAAGVMTLGAGMAVAGQGPQGAGGSGMQFGPVTIVIQGADKDPREIAAEVSRQLGLVAQRDKTAAQARFYQD